MKKTLTTILALVSLFACSSCAPAFRTPALDDGTTYRSPGGRCYGQAQIFNTDDKLQDRDSALEEGIADYEEKGCPETNAYYSVVRGDQMYVFSAK